MQANFIISNEIFIPFYSHNCDEERSIFSNQAILFGILSDVAAVDGRDEGI